MNEEGRVVEAEDKEPTPAPPKKRRKRSKETRPPSAPGIPDAMVPGRPVPRIRGEGPLCPRCGSGMVAKGLVPTNHPFAPRQRYYQCKKRACAHRIKQ